VESAASSWAVGGIYYGEIAEKNNFMGFNQFLDKISTSSASYIQDYQEINQHRGLHSWDPRIKLALLVTAIGLNVVAAKLWLSVGLFSVSLAMVILSHIPYRLFALFFLAPAWATLVVFVGFSAGFGITPIFSIGPLTFYHEGVLQGLSAASRVACDMSWMAAVFLTTPFAKVLDALKWFKIPLVLINVIATAYRYAFLLFDEFFKMRDAARSKGGFRNYRIALHSTAMILTQVILRAYDRANRIQESMTARGESGHSEMRSSFKSESTECPNNCDITPQVVDPNVPVLRCEGVSFAFADGRTLDNISLSVDRGELVVLCGPNGAGKTTLLKLFSGILSANEGKISLCGHLLDRKSRSDAFQYVGMMAQDPNDQLFCTHVGEDIAYGPTNLGLPKEEIDRLVTTAMSLMEVSHLANRPIHRLSYGEMKRVGLAGLIAMQPPLLLLDEPSASLDPATTRHLVKLIKHLNSHHGYTLIIVTHDINLASLLAKRIIILNDGNIAADGSPRKILTDDHLLKSARLEPPILTLLFKQFLEKSTNHNQIPVTTAEALEVLESYQRNASNE
jgi:cobalt/nickel transport system ATP-binding protein